MKEEREEERELKRDEERERKEQQDKEEQREREATLEKVREECMMNMFKVQMDVFLKHHSTVNEQEQEFLKTQQIRRGENHTEGTYGRTKTGQYF